jgi:DNA modification methylase
MGESYSEFLRSKAFTVPESGKKPARCHKSLFDFQNAIVDWAVRRGRAAVFADCGLGKTRIQLEWARQMGPNRTLIVAPLAVADQTISEAREIGQRVSYCTAPPDLPGIWITNYERLRGFVGSEWDAIVLDESSILKSIDGKTRTMLLQKFKHIPYRLCCTATPAPNDLSELGNHADFLGIMTQSEMLSSFFVNDSMSSGYRGWRLKRHAQELFWQWLVSWSLYVRRPSDLGFEDGRFELPKLDVRQVVVESQYVPEGMLFNVGPPKGIQGRSAVRQKTIEARVETLRRIVEERPGHWIIWCALNAEGRSMAAGVGDDAALIEGSDPPEKRLETHRDWIEGRRRVLITKPSIFGWGMNWQHCHQVAFLGIGDSYESYYQAVRRCWRFGQTREVTVDLVVSDAEVGVLENVISKEREAERLCQGIVDSMRDLEIESVRGATRKEDQYMVKNDSGKGWTLQLGDSIEEIKKVEDGSVGLSVFSPPFASLYTYSASDRDLGNTKNYDEFFQHFGYLIPEILRVTQPCRRCCVHVQQVGLTKKSDDVIGWRDFRADVVRHFVEAGWVYDGEVVIDKDPQAQAIRTKSKALTFMQKNKDSAWSRPAMADYILLFRSPGESVDPVKTDVTNEEWIRWARPIWYGIRETETLNVATARDGKDERHICPLQLETIRRCIRLWTNPGDLVLDPFAGIGSTGFEAVRTGRRFHGIELKPSYYKAAIANLHDAEQSMDDLFSRKAEE